MRDIRANFLHISRGLLRLSRQQFLGLLVNLPMPLGKALDQILRDALNLEIPAGLALHLIAEPGQ